MPDQDLALVILDISGYTAFMKQRTIALAHAQFIITALLESVIDEAAQTLQVNKVEGDAVLLFAPRSLPEPDWARMVWERTRSCFDAFNRKRGELAAQDLCQCSACAQTGRLKLKAVVHRGPVVMHRVKHFDELAGTAVIVVHRLVKNDLEASEYILLTEAFCQAWPEAPWSGFPRLMQNYEDIGQVPVRVQRFDEAAAAAPPAGAYPERLEHFLRHMALGARTAVALTGRFLGRTGPVYRNVPDLAPREG